jgi:hypothetical protein
MGSLKRKVPTDVPRDSERDEDSDGKWRGELTTDRFIHYCLMHFSKQLVGFLFILLINDAQKKNIVNQDVIYIYIYIYIFWLKTCLSPL